MYGGVRVGIFIYFVQVSIDGHILQVQFPAKATVGYAQMPLDVNKLHLCHKCMHVAELLLEFA
jgi:hypothetical protein